VVELLYLSPLQVQLGMENLSLSHPAHKTLKL
jgi:hypothetical protein